MKEESDPWRDLALRHLPKLAKVIAEAKSHVDLWQSLKERLSENGVDQARDYETASIYNYAWWCVANSGDAGLVTEVETYFYEDLPVYTDFEDQLPRFVSPLQFERLESSFRYRLNADGNRFKGDILL